MGENTWKSFPGFISPFTSWSQESKPPTNPNHQITIQWFTFTIGSGEGLQVRPRWYPFKTTENNPGLATKTLLQKLLEGTNASAQKVGDAKVFLVYFIRIASMYSIFTYVYVVFVANVGKYTIHGWYVILITYPTLSADVCRYFWILVTAFHGWRYVSIYLDMLLVLNGVRKYQIYEMVPRRKKGWYM